MAPLQAAHFVPNWLEIGHFVTPRRHFTRLAYLKKSSPQKSWLPLRKHLPVNWVRHWEQRKQPVCQLCPKTFRTTRSKMRWLHPRHIATSKMKHLSGWVSTCMFNMQSARPSFGGTNLSITCTWIAATAVQCSSSQKIRHRMSLPDVTPTFIAGATSEIVLLTAAMFWIVLMVCILLPPSIKWRDCFLTNLDTASTSAATDVAS